MTARSPLAWTAAGLGAAALAAVATGAVVERRVVRARQRSGAQADKLGELHSAPVPVRCDDGVVLHAEIDEQAPYDEGSAGRAPGDTVTLVFVHGYALSLDSWHFQREALRGKHRMVFYDQRSHGQSERSPAWHATIDQLGDDLARVVTELAPTGDVVLVGHSMGGMSIMAFAERHPELFADRVHGVALVSTTAGGLRPHRSVVGKLLPDGVGELLAPRVVAALARAPELVDSARRSGSNLGFVLTGLFAFGSDVPAAEVDFLEGMLNSTPFEVLAEFFPTFTELDKFEALEAFHDVEVLIVCGDRDRLTSVGHSRKMASRLPHARLVVCPGAGHMVIFEARDRVNAALQELAELTDVTGPTGRTDPTGAVAG